VNTTSKPTAPSQSGPTRSAAIWGGVPPRNLNFTGREELLKLLHQRMQDGATAVLPQALHGLGGVGKTQLAAEYVYRYRKDYDLVWWISADDAATVRQALVELGGRLGVPSQAEAGKIVTAVLQALGNGHSHPRWLLIYDNAPDPGELQGLVPQGDTGHVLITSRNPNWAVAGLGVEVQAHPAVRDRVCIFYSHRDDAVRKEIAVQLAALRRVSSIEAWDDTRIRPGSKWREEIQRALSRTRVAVLLVSPDFLASDFVMTEEVPTLLAAAEQDGVVILCVIVRHSLFEKFEALSQFQTVNPPDKPLSDLRRSQRERALVALADAIEKAFAA
jgi:hypothetical protein